MAQIPQHQRARRVRRRGDRRDRVDVAAIENRVRDHDKRHIAVQPPPQRSDRPVNTGR